MIITIVSVLPTNGLIDVYVYCHHSALPYIKAMQSIVYLKLEAFYEKSWSSPCREECERGAKDLVMIQVVAIGLSPRRLEFHSGHIVCDLWRMNNNCTVILQILRFFTYTYNFTDDPYPFI
jgi:hypothetical protein